MNISWLSKRISDWFERVILSALQLLLMITIVIAVLDLIYVMWLGLTLRLPSIATLPEMQLALQRAFAAVLLVLIGLELMETLRIYLFDHRVRLEVVLVGALIALCRHIIQLDVAHLDGTVSLGIAALVLALTAGYFLLRRVGPIRQQESQNVAESHPEP